MPADWRQEGETSPYRYKKGYAESDPTDKKYPVDANESMDVLNKLILNGSLVGNDYKERIFTFTMRFEAKQYDFVAWSDLGSIDFKAGI